MLAGTGGGMSAGQPRDRLGRALARRVGWLFGAPLAIFRFARRKMPVEELGTDGGGFRPLPADEPDPEHRTSDHGEGPTLHRLYEAMVREPQIDAERLVAIVAANPNVIAPTEVLRFEKTSGEPGPLREGDELLIRMAGPWNGPVAVTARSPLCIRLAATGGHAQLGQFELRAREEPGGIVLEIQTRERAAVRAFRLLQRIGLIRRMQSYTWAHMLEDAARLAGGRPPDRITVRSWRSGGGGDEAPEHDRHGAT